MDIYKYEKKVNWQAKLFIYILACFFPITSLSQYLAHEILMIGDSLSNSRNYEVARNQYKEAKRLYAVENKSDSVALCVINIGYAFIGERKYQEASLYLDETIGELEKYENIDSFLLAKCYSFLAFTEVRLTAYQDGLEHYNKAITIYEQLGSNHRNVAYAYKGAAQIYLRRMDYPNVVACLKKALKSDSTHTYTAGIYSLLAQSEFFLHHYEQALEYCNIGWEIKKKSQEEIAMLQGTRANIYLEQKDYKKAKALFEEVYEMYTRPVHWDERISLLSSLARIAKEQNQLKQAQIHLEKALGEIDTYHPGKCRERADILVAIGHFEAYKGNNDKAILCYHEAVNQVVPDFESKHIFDNPDPVSFYPEPWIMTALAAKAKALKKRYDIEHHIEDLKAAGEAYVLALEEMDILRSTYGVEQAKLYIGDYVYAYVEAAIEVYYLLYLQTKEEPYLMAIFQLMEKSKARVLKEALQKNEAILLSNIPGSIKKEEQTLRAIKADIATKLAMVRLENEAVEDSIIDLLDRDLLEAEQAYSNFLNQIMDKYPRYEASLVDPKGVSIATIQREKLDIDDLLIEYFWGKDAVYALWIRKNQSGVYKVDDIERLSINLQHFLSYLRDRRKFPEDPKGFYTYATHTYNMLGLPQLLEGKSIDKLWIVPDGLLSYLPFEALITSSEPYDYGNFDFLIKHCNTIYGYTTSMLFDTFKPSSKTRGILKVTPGFSANERGFSTLRYGDAETGKVEITSDLKSIDASLSRFKELVGEHRIIHLSTHSEASENSDVPKIEFIDSSLLLPEIYALNLHADLVVLSSCETGIGTVQKGEGVMSLARGFIFSGAQSLISSMWKVNEQSTASIFSEFYDALSDGDTKAEALRNAKLHYLNTVESDAELSPYFWAGFIFLGNDSTLTISEPPYMAYILLISLFLGIVIYIGRNSLLKKH